ncbi:hypothetical protein M2163_002643 [Streptomyces sp. SAI-135]|nr:hypothetical protein [Streptomyces sp. SAI-090]MDH6615535.1 hypothetical protein [Streptomyces sp. SAI-135]
MGPRRHPPGTTSTPLPDPGHPEPAPSTATRVSPTTAAPPDLRSAARAAASKHAVLHNHLPTCTPSPAPGRLPVACSPPPTRPAPPPPAPRQPDTRARSPHGMGEARLQPDLHSGARAWAPAHHRPPDLRSAARASAARHTGLLPTRHGRSPPPTRPALRRPRFGHGPWVCSPTPGLCSGARASATVRGLDHHRPPCSSTTCAPPQPPPSLITTAQPPARDSLRLRVTARPSSATG